MGLSSKKPYESAQANTFEALTDWSICTEARLLGSRNMHPSLAMVEGVYGTRA